MPQRRAGWALWFQLVRRALRCVFLRVISSGIFHENTTQCSKDPLLPLEATAPDHSQTQQNTKWDCCEIKWVVAFVSSWFEK